MHNGPLPIRNAKLYLEPWMFLLLFAVAFVANGGYLISLLELQRALQIGAPEYWMELGSPKGFAARDGRAMLKALFSSRLTSECERISEGGLLMRVRVLLGVGCIATAVVFAQAVLQQRT